MILVLVMVPAGWPTRAAAQEWDTPAATELVARAALRRDRAEAPDGLQRWDALARGVVLFLTQVGTAQSAPRLVKADELAVEVYWEAPGRSKQTILAWRDQTFLPTDIRYHRDHLGIVANDFGPLIRIGDGDEVRDVPHPLSAAGMAGYHYALVDSLTVSSGGRDWQVYALQVRPRNPGVPAVVGTLFLDRGSAALVRFQFSFTPAAYREATLEDITVLLENALQAGGFWLPWRQEIEIRRRSTVVDLPVRGIIRGRWELSDHRVGAEALAQSAFPGGIGGLRAPGGPTDRWEGSLQQRLQTLMGPSAPGDLDGLRQEIRQWLGERSMRIGPPIRPAIGALSELARFNRVEGLRLGLGATLRTPIANLTIAPWVGVGLASHRTSGRLNLSATVGPGSVVRLQLERAVVDVGQTPVISPLLNSLLAQEFGVDRGDWVERDRVGLGWSRQHVGGLAGAVEIALVGFRPTPVVIQPAHGTFRPNAPFERRRELVVQAQLERRGSAVSGYEVTWRLGAEVGTGSDRYLRVDGELLGRWPALQGEFGFSMNGGWGSTALPPVRGFAIGGWGTLPGVPFRTLGGRRYALARLEWLGDLSLPGIPIGDFAAAEPGVRVGPFVAVGVAGGALAEPGWLLSGGVEPTIGLAAEGLFGLLRLELGYAPRYRRIGVTADLARGWWNVL